VIALHRHLRILSAALLLTCCSSANGKPQETENGETARDDTVKDTEPKTDSEPETASEPDAVSEPDAAPEAAADAAPPSAAAPQITPQQVEASGATVYYLSAGPADAARSLLLLHGASYHSGTWQQLGTIELVAREGFRVIAVDLPGYGKSPSANVDADSFLYELIPLLGLSRPVVLSPSMSGRFSYPLLVQHPEAVGGFVPVAPAATPRYAPSLKGLEVPTLIFWGENDTVFPVEQAQLLAESLPDARTVILAGAGHACYLDLPDKFHQELLGFMRSLP
jgi:pimeloyl-ACP methyl ester carboxylesterase